MKLLLVEIIHDDFKSSKISEQEISAGHLYVKHSVMVMGNDCEYKALKGITFYDPKVLV